ncbi:hypothetical protein ACVK1X_005110 [Pseudomonas sp. PvR086]|jgi:hypothetical protein|uniref:hypothetical protein n=1 Tax=Pseudomonas TaxID=286 RepID=UPI000B35CA23|nr:MULTISPECIES: hypothetical protein [Pseudomonas]MBD9609172.1 hypothetical protein [Pseudomonas sp. PDM08]MBD9619235.1 hypothetical protein [Pseudomonas sp. PDM07]MDR7108717.1 hypothetical protein [Pseudomonas frederiksbergensis]PMY51011.1 hypothetical protein C1X70_18000 [Pseudomonas sp. FW305-53]PMY83776.1 hypothetical protein C1X68_27875 [Pseudomonas sp. FW303-C2]
MSVVMSMKMVFLVSKFLAGTSGVLLFFYRNSLFVQYAGEGTKNPDATHQVLINNHGAYSYITSTQSDHLRMLILAAAALFAVAIAIDLLQKKYRR